MEPNPQLTPRERLIRIGGGAALIVVGCVIFSVSKAHDPGNRAAVLGIIAILAGTSWMGQGMRGKREGPVRRPEAPSEPMVSISAERTALGVLLAWIVPGLGHWFIGRRAKALLYFLTITVTFVIGVALAQGRNLSYERDWIWFLAYMFNAAETALGWLLTRGLELDHKIPYLQVGFLYTAVACLLNVVAMMDFIATCTRGMPAPASEPAPEPAAAGTGEDER
jgi:hypothetical protein